MQSIELMEQKNGNLEKQTVKIDGYSAKCYLHELDHLLGITMKDRCSKLKWDMAKKKSAKYKKLYEEMFVQSLVIVRNKLQSLLM